VRRAASSRQADAASATPAISVAKTRICTTRTRNGL
jgi:hypothetical protein